MPVPAVIGAIGKAALGGLTAGISGGIAGRVNRAITGGKPDRQFYGDANQGSRESFLAKENQANRTSQTASQGQYLAFQAEERERDRQLTMDVERLRSMTSIMNAAGYARSANGQNDTGDNSFIRITPAGKPDHGSYGYKENPYFRRSTGADPTALPGVRADSPGGA